MSEKLKLDLSLILPDVPDERDACVGRLSELLQAEGMEQAHVIRENGSSSLACTTIHSGSALVGYANWRRQQVRKSALAIATRVCASTVWIAPPVPR